MLRVQKILNQLESNVDKNTTLCSHQCAQSQGSRFIQAIDCHAGGEPARIIVGGIPHIKGKTIQEKRNYMMNNMDYIRKLLLTEPRGYPCQNANIIIPPINPQAKFAYIIMEQNKIYPAMSGHNTICVATALLETGMVPMIPDTPNKLSPDGSFTTTFNLEAPAGLIKIKAKCKNGKALRITLTNTTSFIDPKYKNLTIKLPLPITQILSNKNTSYPNDNTVNIDISWGGMWYAIVDIEQLRKYGFELIPSRGKDIVKLGEMIKVAAQEQYPINLTDYYCKDGKKMIDYPGPDILCFREAGTDRNAVVMSNNVLKWDKPETWTGMIDRSPCGTGTAAVMAMLHNKGQLKMGQDFVHESIIGTEFVGNVVKEEDDYIYRKKDDERIKSIIPTISGRAWITAYSQIVLDPTDPFPDGYTVNDIW